MSKMYIEYLSITEYIYLPKTNQWLQKLLSVSILLNHAPHHKVV